MCLAIAGILLTYGYVILIIADAEISYAWYITLVVGIVLCSVCGVYTVVGRCVYDCCDMHDGNDPTYFNNVYDLIGARPNRPYRPAC